MEETKYLPPKYSYAWKDLAKFYDIFEKQVPMSAFSMTSSDKSIVSIFILKFVLVGKRFVYSKNSNYIESYKRS